MKAKTFLKSLRIILTTIFVTAVLCEVTFRIYSSYVLSYDVEMHKYAKALKKESVIKGLSHDHIPNSSATLMGVDIEINNDGFRDKYLSSVKSKYKVQVLGSSITMGWGVNYNLVWTSLLDNEFNKNNIHFINTGVGNYNTELEELAFYNNVKKINPNHVILHYYINDAETILSRSNNFLIKYSYLAAYLYVRIQQASFSKSGISSIGEYYWDMYNNDEKEGWKAARESILNISKYCKNHNINFDLIIQPDLHNLSYESYQLKCHKKIHNFLNLNNINYLDLFYAYNKKFENNPELIWVNPDDSHPNYQGHQINYEETKVYLKKIYHQFN